LHPDLMSVSAVLELDVEVEALREEAAALAGQVEKMKKRIAAVDQERSEIEAKQKENEAAEQKCSREIRDTNARRKNLSEMMTSGAPMDYVAAQRQVEASLKVVGELEARIFELMEAREILDKRLRANHDRRGIEEARLKEASEAQRRRRPDIELKFKDRSAQRKAAHAGLRSDLRRQYDELRERKRPVLVVLQNGVCSFCHSVAPPQMVSEALGGQRCQTCRGCGCWIRDAVSLVPVTDSE